MSIQNEALLPANILTSNQFEEQQIKKNTTEDDLGRYAFLQLFTTQLKNQNPLSPMGQRSVRRTVSAVFIIRGDERRTGFYGRYGS